MPFLMNQSKILFGVDLDIGWVGLIFDQVNSYLFNLGFKIWISNSNYSDLSIRFFEYYRLDKLD